MGSGAQQTSQTSSAPWAAQQPYLEKGFGEASNLYDQGPQSYFPGQTFADFSPAQTQGLNSQINTASDGNPLVTGAANFNTGALNGSNPYGSILNAGASGVENTASGAGINPYLDSMYAAASRSVKNDFSNDVMPSIASSLGKSGMADSTTADLLGAEAGGKLTDSLASLAGNVYGTGYENAANRQAGAQNLLLQQGSANTTNAMNSAPTLRAAQYGDAQALQAAGQTQQDQATKGIEDQINRFNFNQNAPLDALKNYMSMISGNYGSTSTSKTTTAGNPVNSALGGVATLLSLFA